MTRRDLLALAVVSIASAAAGFGAWTWWHRQQGGGTVEMRPDLEFRDLSGQPRRLSEWNGRLLLVNFWATWCAPCLHEMPRLLKAQHDYGGRGLQIVGVAMDTPEPVRRLVERLNIDYPIMVGEADVAAAMDRLGDRLGALPFSVLIAPDGRILDRKSGELKPEDLQAWFDANLPG